jgi:hypothetical protein
VSIATARCRRYDCRHGSLNKFRLKHRHRVSRHDARSMGVRVVVRDGNPSGEHFAASKPSRRGSARLGEAQDFYERPSVVTALFVLDATAYPAFRPPCGNPSGKFYSGSAFACYIYIAAPVLLLALEDRFLFPGATVARPWCEPPEYLRVRELTFNSAAGDRIHAWFSALEGWEPRSGAILHSHGNVFAGFRKRVVPVHLAGEFFHLLLYCGAGDLGRLIGSRKPRRRPARLDFR